MESSEENKKIVNLLYKAVNYIENELKNNKNSKNVIILYENNRLRISFNTFGTIKIEKDKYVKRIYDNSVDGVVFMRIKHDNKNMLLLDFIKIEDDLQYLNSRNKEKISECLERIILIYS